MVTQTRLLYGETDSGNSYISDAEVQTQINQSQTKVALDLNILLTFKTATLVAGTGRYQLYDDFLQMKHVEVFNNSSEKRKKLIKLSMDEFAEVSDGNPTKQGDPAFFKMEYGATSTQNATQRPGDIWLYPVPDASDYDRLRQYFYQAPTALSADADVSELPLHAHDLVCYHTAMILATKDGNQKLMNNMNAIYRQEMESVRETLNAVDREGAFHIQDTQGHTLTSLRRGGGRIARRGPIR